MFKLIASLSLLIFISSNAHAGKLEKGEVYSGEIKKVEHYLYNLNLPKGEWELKKGSECCGTEYINHPKND